MFIASEYRIYVHIHHALINRLPTCLPASSRAIQLSFSFYPPTVYGAFNLTAEVPALSTYQFPGRTNLLLGDTTVSPIVLLQEYTIRFTLSRFLGSTLDPIINADEVYEVHNCDPGSAKADGKQIQRLTKNSYMHWLFLEHCMHCFWIHTHTTNLQAWCRKQWQRCPG